MDIKLLKEKFDLIAKCPNFACLELNSYFRVFGENSIFGYNFIEKLCTKDDFKTCPYISKSKNKIKW